MIRWWRLLGAWVALASGGSLGVGGALIAALWLPGPWAAAVGGGIAAMSAVVAGRGRHQLNRHWELQRELARSIAVQARAGGLPRVREVTDPTLLGVHRAATRPASPGTSAARGLPGYIPRDIDRELRSAVRRGGFTVVVGESTAGKSRAAFEAMRSEVPDHLLAVPAGRESLAVIADRLSKARRSVLWLDDLERFLGQGGVTPAILASLTTPVGGSVTVLATMRAAEYERFAARAEPTVNDQDRPAWQASRAVLRGAHVIPLHRLWSPPELAGAARFADDPRRSLSTSVRQVTREIAEAPPLG